MADLCEPVEPRHVAFANDVASLAYRHGIHCMTAVIDNGKLIKARTGLAFEWQCQRSDAAGGTILEFRANYYSTGKA